MSLAYDIYKHYNNNGRQDEKKKEDTKKKGSMLIGSACCFSPSCELNWTEVTLSPEQYQNNFFEVL